MSGTNKELDMRKKELDMLKTQVGWLHIYALELQAIEERCMPSARRKRALKIRNESAPMFFGLVAGLLQDALIQGLANILDNTVTGRGKKQKPNLVLERAIQSSDASVRASCEKNLAKIRNGATYDDIKKARNTILSHADYATIINYDTMTPKNFPNLTLKNLQCMVEEIREMIKQMAGLTHVSELINKDWQGVKVLFDALELKTPLIYQTGPKTSANSGCSCSI